MSFEKEDKMREIKFRLRSENNKIIGYEKWYCGYYHEEGFYYVAKPCWLYSKDGKKWTSSFIEHRYKDQCTSFHDKTKKEIYEGDILEGLPKGNSRSRAEVRWNINRLQFRIRWRKDSIRVKLILDGSREERMFANTHIVFEVIGNIYENPELLK